MRLLLIRHGESEWNRARRYSGQQDVRLSSLGQEQARRLARRLENEPLAAIHASPLQRARDTANAIGKVKRLPVQLCAELAEIRHGLWEGLTVEEVSAQFPQELDHWINSPHAVVMPEGESVAEVAQRAGKALERIVASPCNGAVAICSHDVVLQVLLLRALDLPLEHYGKWCFENGSITLLDLDRRGSFRLVLLNDTSHLEGLRSDHRQQAL